MMKKTVLPAFVVLHALFFLLPRAGSAGSFENWNPNTAEEIEFGITSLVLGEEESAPWAFEGGYNGAYWFDKDYAVGQTFTVESARQLQSVSTRINAGGATSGQFEIAIYEFDQASQSTTNRVAFATGEADSYRYDTGSVPVSTFDLSGFSATLSAGQTYMLTFRGLEGSAGNFYAQAATNIYDGGCVFLGRYVPSGPDLTGTWVLKKTGNKTRGKLLVENRGSEAAEDGYAIDVHLSDDGVTPGEFLFSREVSDKRKRPYKNFRMRFRAPEDAYVLAVIDPDDTIAETDEDNNIIVLQSPANP